MASRLERLMRIYNRLRRGPVGGQVITFEAPKLSPDGTKIVFIGATTASNNNDDDIYICNIDGSGVTKIYDMPVGTGHTALGGAY